jgi:preprotein translocase subunit YajC
MTPWNPVWTPVALQIPAGGAQGTLLAIVPWVLMFVIFYVIVMVPHRKRQKALQEQINNLKKGDRVITTGGIYGEVAALDGATLVLKIADNVKVKIVRSAIAGLEGEGDQGGKS